MRLLHPGFRIGARPLRSPSSYSSNIVVPLRVTFSNGTNRTIFHSPYTLPSSVSYKPFSCRSYENCRGVYQQFQFWFKPIATTKGSSALVTSPHYCIQVLSFHTLAHSFALTKNSTLLFSTDSALFAKKHRGWGGWMSKRSRLYKDKFMERSYGMGGAFAVRACLGARMKRTA